MYYVCEQYYVLCIMYVNNKHVINHKALQCNKCTKDFNSWSDVLEHDQNNHQDKQFQNKTSLVFIETMLAKFDL